MLKWLQSRLRQFRSRRPVHFYNQGAVLAEQGRTGEAIAAYTRAIETDAHANAPYRDQLPPWLRDHPFEPDDRIYSSPKSFFNRGCIYLEFGQLTEATQDFSHAIDLCPEFNNAFDNRASCYLLIGERTLADREYSKSLEALTRAKQDVLHVAEREGALHWMGANTLLSVETSMASVHCGMECSLEAWNACCRAIGMWFQLVASAQIDAFPKERKQRIRRMRCAEARSLRQLLCWLISHVSDAQTLRGVAHGCLDVGRMCHDKLKMLDLAEELFRRGRLVCDRLPSDEVEPQAAGEYTVQSLRARACNYLGLLYIESGRADEALCACLAAVECREKRRMDAPEDLENVVYLGGAYCNLGRAAIDCWRLDEAVAYLARSGETLDGAVSQCGPELTQIALEFRHNAAAVLEEANKWKAVSAPPPEATPQHCLEFVSGATYMVAMASLANPSVSLPAGVESAISLYNAGKAADAVVQLSAWLSEHVDCAEGWFWKGVMLSDMASIAVEGTDNNRDFLEAMAMTIDHTRELREFREATAMFESSPGTPRPGRRHTAR